MRGVRTSLMVSWFVRLVNLSDGETAIINNVFKNFPNATLYKTCWEECEWKFTRAGYCTQERCYEWCTLCFKMHWLNAPHLMSTRRLRIRYMQNGSTNTATMSWEISTKLVPKTARREGVRENKSARKKDFTICWFSFICFWFLRPNIRFSVQGARKLIRAKIM